MPAPLGICLILDLDGSGPCSLKLPHGPHDVQWATVTGVRVGHDRDVDRSNDPTHVLDDLGHRRQTDVWHSELSIGEAGSGRIDDLRASLLDDPRGERVKRARCDDNPWLR